MRFDVSYLAQCHEAVQRFASEVVPIEILVNNSGTTRDPTLVRMTREMWDQVVDTNLGSCFNLCKLTWDGMREKKFGRIVNVGSVNGQAGQYGQVNYAAAKSGIHGFTKALGEAVRQAVELRDRICALMVVRSKADNGDSFLCLQSGELALLREVRENSARAFAVVDPLCRRRYPVAAATPQGGYTRCHRPDKSL